MQVTRIAARGGQHEPQPDWPGPLPSPSTGIQAGRAAPRTTQLGPGKASTWPATLQRTLPVRATSSGALSEPGWRGTEFYLSCHPEHEGPDGHPDDPWAKPHPQPPPNQTCENPAPYRGAWETLGEQRQLFGAADVRPHLPAASQASQLGWEAPLQAPGSYLLALMLQECGQTRLSR